MATDKRPTMLRIPDDMYEKIRLMAFIEKRSVNGQIEFAIEQSIRAFELKHGKIPQNPFGDYAKEGKDT